MSEANAETPPQPAGELVRATGTREVNVSPTFAAYYTNDTEVQTGPWDVRLRLGQIAEVDSERNHAIITRVAEVRMSPQHAKRVVAILMEHLERYEAKYGPIPLPQD
jgi:hypothetical protein